MKAATGRTLRVKCSSWDQVEQFYLRKLHRGRLVTIRVPFVPVPGDAISLGLELPNDLVVAVDGTIARVHPSGDDRSAVEIELHGLTPDVVDRLEALVADGRRASSPRAVAPPPPEDTTPDPSYQLLIALDGELRQMRLLAVHEVLGVSWDASAIEVRSAWRRLCLRYHPDAVAQHRSAAVSHLAEELMILVNRAYDRMRAALVAEGRASALGPALHPEKGWLVAFDAISTGEVAAPPPSDSARRRKNPTTGHPSVSFEPTTDQIFAELAEEKVEDMSRSSIDAARAVASDNVFEKQARARLIAGDHQGAREILAAALYVYPKNSILRALYHVAAAMEALDEDQSERAAAQLEAALSADPGCREARLAWEELRRRAAARARP